MATLTNKMEPKETHWYIECLIWLKDNALAWTSFILGWKAIDLTFKWLKDGREAAIRNIVRDEINKSMAGKLDNLSDKVEQLGHAVFELRNKL